MIQNNLPIIGALHREQGDGKGSIPILLPWILLHSKKYDHQAHEFITIHFTDIYKITYIE